MALDPQKFAKAIALWLEQEYMAGRSPILDESSLRHPVSIYLQTVSTEVTYPSQAATVGASKAVDFAVFRSGGTGQMSDAIEAKWITSSRSYTQEVFDDILRLENLNTSNLERWFLIAGRPNDIDKKIKKVEFNPGNKAKRKRAFEDVLGWNLDEKINVKCGDDISGRYKFWKSATKAVSYATQPPKLPSSIDITLRGVYPGSKGDFEFKVFVWRINRVSNRAERHLI